MLNTHRKIFLAFCFVLISVPVLGQQPLGDSFTYQGELIESGVPADGVYDFRVSLMDALVGGMLLDSASISGVQVNQGVFTIELDFGSAVFNGFDRWLEIEVQAAGGGGFVTLSPRQRLAATPNALFSKKVADDSVGADQIVPSEVQLRVVGSCVGGESIAAINQDGTVVCDVDASGPWVVVNASIIYTPTDNVGVNTSSPLATLHVNDAGTSRPAILVEGASAAEGDLAYPIGEVFQLGTWEEGTQNFERALQIDGAGTVLVNDDLIFDDVLGDKISLFGDRNGDSNNFGFGVEANTLVYKSNGAHSWLISDNFGEPPHMHLTTSGLGLATTNLGNYRLAVNGGIRAKEVVVETGWSDYVFESDYHLRSLSEVEDFISENGHLPDVPSAEEVAANGVSLGTMDATLLRKIEELTLYTLELHSRIAELEAALNEVAQ